MKWMVGIVSAIAIAVIAIFLSRFFSSCHCVVTVGEGASVDKSEVVVPSNCMYKQGGYTITWKPKASNAWMATFQGGISPCGPNHWAFQQGHETCTIKRSTAPNTCNDGVHQRCFKYFAVYGDNASTDPHVVGDNSMLAGPVQGEGGPGTKASPFTVYCIDLTNGKQCNGQDVPVLTATTTALHWAKPNAGWSLHVNSPNLCDEGTQNFAPPPGTQFCAIDPAATKCEGGHTCSYNYTVFLDGGQPVQHTVQVSK